MNRIMIVVAVVALCVGAVQADPNELPKPRRLTAWFMAESDPDSNYLASAQVGYMLSHSLELGMMSTWRPDTDEPGHVWGAYGAYHFPGKVLGGQLFVGGDITLDLESEGDRTLYGPNIGLIFDPVVLKYSYRMATSKLDAVEKDEHWFGIGLRIQF